MAFSQNRKPRKKRNFAVITVVEFLLSVLTVIVFWQDILTVLTATIDFLFPRQNLTLPQDTIDSLLALITVGAVAAINLLVFLLAFTRKAGLPVFGFDDIANNVPLESDEPAPSSLGNHQSQPVTTPIRSYFAGRISQILTGTFLQLLWFFGLRGMNTHIRYGSSLSREMGTAQTLIPGSIASDFDSAYVLDSPQNEGDRQNILPITGWYGLRFPFRRSLRGSVKLDRIFRQENKVTAFTRDGIEVTADISTAFSLGQRSECLEIAFYRPYQMLNQRIVRSKKVDEPFPGVEISTDENEELDEQDKYFIHQQLRSLINSDDPKEFVPTPNSHVTEFNRDRVFRAITSQSLIHHGDFQEWEQIPLHYAKDIFEKIMLNYTFEELFGERKKITGDDYPIFKINDDLRRQVRNNSVLSFRILRHRRSLTLADTEEGDEPYQIAEVLSVPNHPEGTLEPRFSIELPAAPLKPELANGGKLLRARGIRLLAAEFENLRPRFDEVNQTQLYSWSSDWEKDTSITQGEAEFECMKIMSESGKSTQRQLVNNLLLIFQSGRAEEVVLMQFMSALQSLVNRPDYENILPRDANNLLNQVQKWFKESSEGSV